MSRTLARSCWAASVPLVLLLLPLLLFELFGNSLWSGLIIRLSVDMLVRKNCRNELITIKLITVAC